jgi:hypothetical protein
VRRVPTSNWEGRSLEPTATNDQILLPQPRSWYQESRRQRAAFLRCASQSAGTADAVARLHRSLLLLIGDETEQVGQGADQCHCEGSTLAVLASVCNLFTTERSLTSRSAYEQASAAAIAVQRTLCAA